MKMLSTFILTVLASVSTYGALTINFGAAVLRTSTGEPMADNGLVIIGASTLDGSFGIPTPSAFFSGDDAEIYRGVVSPAGEFAASAILTLSGNWNQGDPMMIYWYPTLTSGATTPGAGTAYGSFRTDAIQDGNTIAWLTPTDPNTADTLNFLTQSANGSNPDSAGWASLTVVPEPVTWALAWFGGIVLAVGSVRRWRAKRS